MNRSEGKHPDERPERQDHRLRGAVVPGHDLIHGAEQPERIPFNMETSMPGVFAAGDCRSGSTKQVASAVGEGASAAIAIREFLKTI